MSEKMELVEIDPATGQEDQLVATGTMAKLSRRMDALLADAQADWNENDYPWPAYRIQPAG